jgi:iron complex outermembrane receptor protein
LLPGIDLSYSPIKFLSIVGSYNYTIGQPTFTDLNYQGPTNQGNTQLRPYSQHSYETGVKLKLWNIQAGILGFYTHGHNNINWVRNETTNRYTALNTELSENMGIETSIRYKNTSNNWTSILASEVYLGYTYIDTYRSDSKEYSKYTNIKHKAVAHIEQNIAKGLLFSWNLMYKQRIGTYLTYNFDAAEYIHTAYPDAILVDLRATYSFYKFKIYLEGSNLLDQTYVESGSISQPGRWFKAGVNVTLDY